jgi:hypothetical protein
LVLPAPLVDAEFVDDGDELLLVESEEPPHPPRAAARLITMAVVSAAAVVRRDRAVIRQTPWGDVFSYCGGVRNRSPRSINCTYFIEITRMIGVLCFAWLRSYATVG